MLFINKYREMILYLVFGVFTTIVNLSSYFIFTRFLNFNFITSNIISWVVAVLFAYITNKFFVFESKVTGFKDLIKEFIAFVSCRLFSGILDIAIMYAAMNILYINDILVKIITNIIVIILNFIFSKLVIFKSEKKVEYQENKDTSGEFNKEILE